MQMWLMLQKLLCGNQKESGPLEMAVKILNVIQNTLLTYHP